MQRQVFLYTLLTVVLFSGFFSCTKEVDFDQAEDLEISPVLETSLVFFDETVNSFLVNNLPVFTIEDAFDLDIFKNDFVVDNLIKAEFEFEGVNSIVRAFEIDVAFLDEADVELHSFTFTMQESTDGSDVPSEHIEVFENDKLTNLTSTTRITFALRMLPGTGVDQTTPGRLQLKSKAVFYLNIEG